MVLHLGSSCGSAGSCSGGTTRGAAGWSPPSRGSGACGQQSRLLTSCAPGQGPWDSNDAFSVKLLNGDSLRNACGRDSAAPRPCEASVPRGGGRGRAGRAAMHGQRAGGRREPCTESGRCCPAGTRYGGEPRGCCSAGGPTVAPTGAWPGLERGRLQGGTPGSGAASATIPACLVFPGFAAGTWRV